MLGFDAIFDSERTFLMDLLPKFFKKQFSLRLVDASKDFSFRCTNKKSKPGFVTPTEFPGEAVEIFSGYALS